MRKSSVKGLFLWRVGLFGNVNHLWITTHKNDIAMATKKAETFIRKYAEYKEYQIKSVESCGTLDA